MSQRTPINRVSADINQDRLAQLRQLIPEAFTEGKIDFDKLRSALSDVVDTNPERYSFTWAGKQDAIRLLQAPATGTLVPCPDESVNWAQTNHLFIEGDNLEVLKLLYKAYFDRVKLIYIDPPYNTGNDFIYPDNFRDTLIPYLRLTGQSDANGNVLTSNPETSGRYHSDWLSMMYPRLFIARQLLSDDGTIFISINDTELPRLRLLMDEVFGEECFIGTFVWKSRHNVDSRNKTGMSSDHEYILVYGKQIQGQPIDTDKYSNPDGDPRGDWMSDNMVGLATKDKRPNLHYDLVNPETGINYGCPEKGWRYSRSTMARKIAEGRVLWPSSPDGRPREKRFLQERGDLFTGRSSLLVDVPTTSVGTQEVRELFGADVYDFPKPIGLIKAVLKQIIGEEGIVLDFFAGSCPVSQAIYEINAERNSNYRFVVVQLPEPTEHNSPARQSGYNSISEIGKERIRRAGHRIRKRELETLPASGNSETANDTGLRVFKLASSNFRSWSGVANATPEEYTGEMSLFTDPIVDGANPMAVLWEVAIKEGYSLMSRIQRKEVDGNTVFFVIDEDNNQRFHICLDNSVSADLARSLRLTQDDLFVCRDIALDDTAAANLALLCRLKTI